MGDLVRASRTPALDENHTLMKFNSVYRLKAGFARIPGHRVFAPHLLCESGPLARFQSPSSTGPVKPIDRKI